MSLKEAVEKLLETYSNPRVAIDDGANFWSADALLAEVTDGFFGDGAEFGVEDNAVYEVRDGYLVKGQPLYKVSKGRAFDEDFSRVVLHHDGDESAWFAWATGGES